MKLKSLAIIEDDIDSESETNDTSDTEKENDDM